MKTKKKLLVLGSDNGTIDFVREAHKMGLYVIVADNMETSPTKEAADEQWLISTTEIDILEKKCREENIDGIVYRCDFNATQGRILCKRLGLPHYNESDEAWSTANNKGKFKRHCLEVGAPVLKGYHLTDELLREDLDKIVYPVVCKPVDKSGNRGMSYCKTEEELIKAYRYARSISDNEMIIVERELHGPEFAVNYLLADGHAQLYFFSSEHNEPGELENLYSVITTTSYHLKQYIEEVNDKVIEVLKKIGCRDGVAWVETMLDEDGHFYLLEMGYRFGGEMVNVPYEYISGFNSLRWMIEIALGIQHKKADLPKPLTFAEIGVAATYFMFSIMDGYVGRLYGLEEIEKLPNVIVDLQKRDGKRVNYHAIMGALRIYGKDIEELIDTIKLINRHLKIVDKDGNNMFIYYTDFESLRVEYKNGLREFNLE